MDFIRRAQFDSAIIESLRSAFFTLLDPSNYTEPAKSKLNPMEEQFVNLLRGRKGISVIMDSIKDDTSTVLSSSDLTFAKEKLSVDVGDFDQKVTLLKKNHAAEIISLKVQLEKSQEKKVQDLQKQHDFEIQNLKSKLKLLEELLRTGDGSTQATSSGRKGVPEKRAASSSKLPTGSPRAGRSPQRGGIAIGTSLP